MVSELINETINKTVEIAKGSIEYSPPQQPTALTLNIIFMIIGIFVIYILYRRMQKLRSYK